MLQAASTSTPASSFFARLHQNRSASYDSNTDLHSTGPSTTASSPAPSESQQSFNQPATLERERELRRAATVRTPGPHGGGATSRGRDLQGISSFTAAGSDLASVSPSIASETRYTPPPASRHPLFSHHAIPPTIPLSGLSSPSGFSDPGPSGPPSPSGSAMSSSGGFSPASAFLSHFSSSTSLRNGAPPLEYNPDAPGVRVLDYTLGKLLGRGGFSSVRMATHVHTGEVLACKIVKRDDLSDRSGSLERFEEEISLWKSLPRHPSLLPLLEMHRTPVATFLFIPFMPGGSLLDVLRREGGSEKTARRWFPGVVTAVAAMHEGYEGSEGGLLHGDLKLDNFLVDHEGEVMVCDFGMARRIGCGDSSTFPTIPPPIATESLPVAPYTRGRPRFSSPLPSMQINSYQGHSPRRPIDPSPTPQAFPSASLPYAPPELLRAPPAPSSLAQDIWALGVILHALLTGKLPFVDAFDPRLQMKILRGSWQEPVGLGSEWLELLHGCLDGNRETRWDVAKVRQCDALTGWREVKSRTKSRSRSRARRDHSSDRFDLGLRSSAQPIPTPRRDHSRGRGPRTPHTIQDPTAPYAPRFSPASYPAVGKKDSFNGDLVQVAEGDESGAGVVVIPSDGMRSRSVSASRSRSSGSGRLKGNRQDSGETPLFQLDPFTFPPRKEAIPEDGAESITRGRTTTKRPSGSARFGLSVQSVPFTNPLTPMTGLDGEHNRSKDNDKKSQSPSAGRTRDPSPFAPAFPWSTRAAPSPTPSHDSPMSSSSNRTSRSRSRPRSAGRSTASLLGYDLEIVNEEGRDKGDTGVPVGGARSASRGGRGVDGGRSRSRGRMGGDL